MTNISGTKSVSGAATAFSFSGADLVASAAPADGKKIRKTRFYAWHDSLANASSVNAIRFLIFKM
jgi:hypothetical protein